MLMVDDDHLVMTHPDGVLLPLQHEVRERINEIEGF